MTTTNDNHFAARISTLAKETYRQSYSALAARNAKLCIADTIAVALAGAKEPCVEILTRTPGVCEAPGKSRLWGRSGRTSVLDASLVNATASHALDYDDMCAVFGGHHSAPLVAPLFALGDERDISGEELLRAYIAGVEVEVRLARALNPEHYSKGWHPTSMLGVFGAAAAAGCLIGLDEARLAQALSIAASMSCGIKANFGSMTKPLHIGTCARSGVLAALLADGGYDAGSQAFEGKQGYFEVYNGSGKYLLGRALDERGPDLEIEGKSVGVKQFPCCGSTHAAVTAALRLRDDHGLKPQQIKRLRILPNGNRLAHTNKPDPQSALEAKFSVQYVVARALTSGDVRLEHFSDTNIRQPEIRELLKKADAEPHPEMPLTGDHLWGAEVIAELESGEVVSHRIADLHCRDGNYPMNDDEFWEKFEDCAGPALTAGPARVLFDQLNGLESVRNVRDVTGMLSV